MNNLEKKQIIYNILKTNGIIRENEKEADFIVSDIFLKSAMFLDVFEDENEVYNYLQDFINSLIQRDSKEPDMTENILKDNIDSIKDPRTIIFDITDESKYIRKILKRLAELDRVKPNKKYISIFYRKYIKGVSFEQVAHELNISDKELKDRIFDIVKFVSKDWRLNRKRAWMRHTFCKINVWLHI